MAYLHCHSCDWSQDDFWSVKYNPVTKFWDDIKWLWYPRLMGLDAWLINDLTAYTGIPIFSTKSGKVFTWNWLALEFVKEIKVFFQQKWWTYASWKRHSKTAVCPKCGNRNFDID